MIIFSGRIHWGFGVILWVLVQSSIDDVFLNPIPFLIGCVFPDADHPKAPVGRILPLHWFFNHRGFTHTIPAMLICSFPIGVFYSWKWAILFGVGYVLHLAMDSSTPMGIRWWRGHRKRAYR